jgi:hypothetical protein
VIPQLLSETRALLAGEWDSAADRPAARAGDSV